MNQNGQTASKRNKNRSSSNAINSMPSNVSRAMNRPPSMRNNYSMNMRGDNNNMPQQHQTSRNYSNNNNNNRSLVNSQINSSSTVVPANHPIVEMCSGVYKNKRLVHTMTSLIGCLIEVQLEDGKRYEGILKTFSSEFELALCTAASVVEEPSSEKRNLGNNIGNLLAALERNEEVTDTLVIDPKKLVTFKALNVDLDFATKKAAMTDSEIAKHDGTKQQKELVPWVGDDNENTESGFEALDDGSNNVSNGWNTEDMFKLNESKYHIETSYKEDMSEYTIKLQHRNDEEYRQREARAAKIAKEIEQDSNRVARYNKEDETDEEARYSAVIRTTDEANNLPASSNDNMNNNNNNTNITASNTNNSNYHTNYNSRNDINHPREDQRRENNPRNNPEAMGFRAQNTRPNRSRMGGNRGGPSGPNEANWRDSNRSMQTNRFNHQTSMSYSKSASGGGGGGYSGPTAKYMNASSNQPQQQQQQQQHQQQQQQQQHQQQQHQQQQYPNVASSQAKTYSAVSARSVPNDSNVGPNDNEPIKTYANRSSGGHVNNNEDGYQRKPTGQLPQRESYKQQQQQQQQQQPRTSYSRIVDQQPHQHHPQQQQQHHHDIKSPSSSASSSIKHFESDLSKTTTSHPTSPSTPTHEPLLKSTSAAAKTEVVTGGKLKHVDESGHHHHHQQQPQHHQGRITSPKNIAGSGVETKKPESAAEAVKKANIKSQISNTKDVASQQHQPVDSDIKKTDSPSTPISSSSSSSPLVASTIASNLSHNTGTNTSAAASAPMQQTNNTSAVSLPNAGAAPSPGSQGDEIAISSKLNPNAKSFTPRTSHPNVILAPHTTPTPANVMQQQQQPPPPPPPSYYPMAVSGAGHISTTPPSIPSTPSMPPGQTPTHFLQYHPNPGAAAHLATHPNHHHQQQQIRFINNNHMQFSYNPMLPQMVPAQYLPLNHVQHYPPPMQAGVAPAPPASQSSAPPPQQVGANQPNGPPNSQITSHHMITNTTVSNQVGTPNNGQSQPQPMPQQTQSNQSQQSRSHYRSGSKGPSNQSANQQSQPMMRHPHDYSHQNVANVTGQPIMAGAAHGAQHLAPLLYSPTAVAVHPNPNQMHGQQQPQSIGQLAPQSGHNPAIPFIYQYPRPLLSGHHPNAMNIALQPGLFQESHLSVFCSDMPSQMVAQTMPGPPPQPMPPQGANMPPQAPTASVGPGGQVPSSSSPTTQGSVSAASVSQQQQTF